MRVVLAAAMIALLTTTAFAQDSHVPRYGEADKEKTPAQIEDGEEPMRINVWIQGEQTVEYWENQGYTDPEPDARGHFWFPQT